MKPARLTAVLVTLLVLSGCTSYRSFEKARDYEQTKQWDEAVEAYLTALEVDPTNKRYIAGLQNAKLEASRVHFAKGKAFRAADQPALAALEFELTVKLDPTNQFALVELASAVESVCVHGDEPGAVRHAQAVRAALEASGFELGPLP